MTSHFLHLLPYSKKKVGAIVGEANRVQRLSKHVENPRQPSWILGSAGVVSEAVEKYMMLPTIYRSKGGRVRSRRQRHDHRCLVAGVISWPEDVESLKRPQSKERVSTMHRFFHQSLHWLDALYGESLVAAVLHVDEKYPHVHFFLVGDANKLHPGLRAEFVNGHRLTDGKEKRDRHRRALTMLQDDFHLEVGRHFGLSRRSSVKPRRRIKDRNAAQCLLELRKYLEERGCFEELGQLDSVEQMLGETSRRWSM